MYTYMLIVVKKINNIACIFTADLSSTCRKRIPLAALRNDINTLLCLTIDFSCALHLLTLKYGFLMYMDIEKYVYQCLHL